MGGVTTSLNAPSNANYTQTLANVENGYYNADENTTMDTFKIYYVDTLTASAGSLVSYVPQFKTVDSTYTGTFSLNRTNYSGGVTRESTISIAECEEILTGQAPSILSSTANHAYVQSDTISATATIGQGANFYVDDLFSNQFYASITPSTTNAKIKIDIVVCIGIDGVDAPHDLVMWLVRSVGGSAPRGGTQTELKSTDAGTGDEYIHIGLRGTADDDHLHTFRISYIDEPNTTSTTTYSIRGTNQHASSSAAVRFNGSYSLASAHSDRGVSLFQLQEIDAAPQLSNVSTTGAQAGQALVYNSSNQWVPGPTIPFYHFMGPNRGKKLRMYAGDFLNFSLNPNGEDAYYDTMYYVYSNDIDNKLTIPGGSRNGGSHSTAIKLEHGYWSVEIMHPFNNELGYNYYDRDNTFTHRPSSSQEENQWFCLRTLGVLQLFQFLLLLGHHK